MRLILIVAHVAPKIHLIVDSKHHIQYVVTYQC